MNEPKPHPMDTVVATFGVKPFADLIAEAFDRVTSGPDGEDRLVAYLERVAKERASR